MLKSNFLRLATILLPAALAAQLVPAAGAGARQAPEAHYRAFDSKGRPVKLQEIVDALDKADVLIVGETHNDGVAHLLEAELLRRADETYGPSSQTKANPHGGAHLLEAQTLRVAWMAYSIADYLKRQRGALVVQVNGTFHSEERLGVPEQLAHYRPNARIVVVTIIPDEGFPNFDVGRLGKLGDFVILTDPSLPRSSS